MVGAQWLQPNGVKCVTIGASLETSVHSVWQMQLKYKLGKKVHVSARVCLASLDTAHLSKGYHPRQLLLQTSVLG